MATDVNAHGSVFEAGTARSLFDARPQIARWSYDVSPDGQRFLVNTSVEQMQEILTYSLAHVTSTPLTLVANWQEELKRRVPTR